MIAEEWVQPGEQEASEQPDEPCAARGQHPEDGLRVGHRSAGTDLGWRGEDEGRSILEVALPLSIHRIGESRVECNEWHPA